jgi:hypothetical protein
MRRVIPRLEVLLLPGENLINEKSRPQEDVQKGLPVSGSFSSAMKTPENTRLQ